MGLKSRTKGKVGEREAVNFLRSLGFEDAQRTQQFNGLGKSDIICPESFPRIHFEVKYGYDKSKLDVHSSVLLAACEQARFEAQGRPWVVLWRPKGNSNWRATFDGCGMRITVAEEDVKAALYLLNETIY